MSKLAIAIDLDELRELRRLMREFMETNVFEGETDRYAYEWRFEHFLLWLRRKRQEQPHEQRSD